ncbi:MAG: hypothetical protein IT186_20975 [Acidobacteria bacterium]|nr:hypothetical protein [Acidobacteriota bacterium]MCK6684642.1 hypothetical protein [Thermoanaerobaculia bacterium]
MKKTHRILEFTLAYRLTQGWGFAEQKWLPVLKHNDTSSVRRALDVGCGPGTNAAHFS